jgi:amino acid adenylation domain-containing protein
LKALGVRAESRVAICLERSELMIIALLGVLKAGAAYVPLDPQYPQARLLFMLDDSQASVLITTYQLRESLFPNAETNGMRVVTLDQEWGLFAGRKRENPVTEVSAGNLAYLIYTSGSTGVPKGVQITHRALVNFLHSMRQEPGLTAADRLLAVTTLSFDIAGLELYLPLLVGARLVLASRAQAVDAQALRRLISEAAVTALQATPATWRMLLESGWEGDSDLKVLCGGEALPAELSVELRRRSEQVWNLYGPTETTIWSLQARVPAGEWKVSIGTPLANTRVYVLDAGGGLAPVGVAGELYIGGEGLARGYWRRAELTAERFVPDGVSGRGGERLYRTGDLVRWRREGELEYLGRLDQQVKVRGYRIELGEIEAALGELNELAAAVVAVQTSGGEARLVAYLVARGEERLAVSALREQLQQRLPEYMVPSVYMYLEQLPLTANGKVDRRALPAVTEWQVGAERYEAPRTATEEIVAGIWAHVLRVVRVGVGENFFELGGHSLLATQVMSRLRKSFGVELALRE